MYSRQEEKWTYINIQQTEDKNWERKSINFDYLYKTVQSNLQKIKLAQLTMTRLRGLPTGSSLHKTSSHQWPVQMGLVDTFFSDSVYLCHWHSISAPNTFVHLSLMPYNHSKAIPLRAWIGPEGSRRLRLPDFKTVGTWRRYGCQPYTLSTLTPPPGNIPGTHFC